MFFLLLFFFKDTEHFMFFCYTFAVGSVTVNIMVESLSVFVQLNEDYNLQTHLLNYRFHRGEKVVFCVFLTGGDLQR